MSKKDHKKNIVTCPDCGRISLSAKNQCPYCGIGNEAEIFSTEDILALPATINLFDQASEDDENSQCHRGVGVAVFA